MGGVENGACLSMSPPPGRKSTMPHVAFVPLTGFRVREEALRELGVSLPGLADRGAAIARLPALGLLTLAGMTPEPWTCSYHDTGEVGAAAGHPLGDVAAKARGRP